MYANFKFPDFNTDNIIKYKNYLIFDNVFYWDSMTCRLFKYSSYAVKSFSDGIVYITIKQYVIKNKFGSITRSQTPNVIKL